MHDLDQWLSPVIRADLENRFYAVVNAKARMERVQNDPTFWPTVMEGKAVALFSDHGVVHVRDVARQILIVLRRAHGVLIPQRSAERLAHMQGYGVILAYLHDIGMFDFSTVGRAMHPEYATQAVFSPQMDDLLATVWATNSGNLPAYLSHLAAEGALDLPPATVLRELLALAIGHSKTKIPTDVLNDPEQLRARLIEVLSTDLHHLWAIQHAGRARGARQSGPAEDAMQPHQAWAAQSQPEVIRFYPHWPDDAFGWLVADHPRLQALASDAVDTVRALRCADALRQRGEILKTSGGYEIFVSQETANAIYSLQLGDESLYLLELADPISIGEANLASSELTVAGDIRLSFHRGAFATEAATSRAVQAAARVIDDILYDTMDSFIRPSGAPDGLVRKRAAEMQVLLEEIDDSAEFVARVRDQLERVRPELRGRIRLVPSLHNASDSERALYLAGATVDWDEAACRELLGHLLHSGHRSAAIDIDRAFQDVHQIRLQAGDVLMEAGAPAGFVYIPMSAGLHIEPLGGYEPLEARAWTPLGVTGVIRGATRNGTVIADGPLDLLMIPRGVYLREWHFTHSPESLREALSAPSAPSGAQS